MSGWGQCFLEGWGWGGGAQGERRRGALPLFILQLDWRLLLMMARKRVRPGGEVGHLVTCWRREPRGHQVRDAPAPFPLQKLQTLHLRSFELKVSLSEDTPDHLTSGRGAEKRPRRRLQRRRPRWRPTDSLVINSRECFEVTPKCSGSPTNSNSISTRSPPPPPPPLYHPPSHPSPLQSSSVFIS